MRVGSVNVSFRDHDDSNGIRRVLIVEALLGAWHCTSSRPEALSRP